MTPVDQFIPIISKFTWYRGIVSIMVFKLQDVVN